jgi:hypothetical protein
MASCFAFWQKARDIIIWGNRWQLGVLLGERGFESRRWFQQACCGTVDSGRVWGFGLERGVDYNDGHLKRWCCCSGIGGTCGECGKCGGKCGGAGPRVGKESQSMLHCLRGIARLSHGNPAPAIRSPPTLFSPPCDCILLNGLQRHDGPQNVPVECVLWRSVATCVYEDWQPYLSSYKRSNLHI